MYSLLLSVLSYYLNITNIIKLSIKHKAIDPIRVLSFHPQTPRNTLTTTTEPTD